jgi:hypothetical protein
MNGNASGPVTSLVEFSGDPQVPQELVHGAHAPTLQTHGLG